ncbi:MAG: hypothetical protein ACU83O_14010 [Gammaproteobacteria bacterium]
MAERKRLMVLKFLMAMLERISKPLVVILDHTPVHAAKKLKPYRVLLEDEGIQFYLPLRS